MEAFQILITDDRYSVPTLIIFPAEDAERARLAAKRLLADEHHLAVEVWDDETRLFALPKPTRRRSKPPVGAKAVAVAAPSSR